MSRRHRSRTLGLSLGVLSLAALGVTLTTAAAPVQGSTRYEVTITNVTRGQIFSPALVASHGAGVSFFTLGAPASPGLQLMAEEGDNSMMLNSLASNSEVSDVRSDSGPLMPGATTSVVVTANAKTDLISVAGMLVSTNDALFAVRGIHGPAKSVTVYARAYDAGTEANSEDCAWIPGPPCGSAGAHDPSPSEGYVHVHAGVHGIGSLVPADHDWRDVVAEIRIERMKN